MRIPWFPMRIFEIYCVFLFLTYAQIPYFSVYTLGEVRTKLKLVP